MATKYKMADVRSKWVTKVKKRKIAVMRQSANDLFEQASRTKPGRSRGGLIVAGYVPVKDGFLAASAVSGLNGSTSLTGDNAYVMTVARMKEGDKVMLGWTAKYARRLHYDGWLWVDSAANNWQSIVKAAVAKARARYP